jgi:Tol biopolymer transport system component
LLAVTVSLPGVRQAATAASSAGPPNAEQLAGAGTAAEPEEIVFLSTADSADQGEIWALERGRAPRDLSKSHFADQHAAVSPDGARVAFWSDRNGIWQVFLVGTNGRGLRRVFTVERGRDFYPGFPGTSFSQDGRTLALQYRPTSPLGARPRFAFVDLGTGNTRRLRLGCLTDAVASPDGRRVACAVRPGKVAVIDRNGRRLFTVRGDANLWLSPDRVAVGRRPQTLVLDARGSVVARLKGSAVSVSADGRLLALTRLGSITVVDLSTYRTIRTIKGRRDWEPYVFAFTPDGEEIAYYAPDDSVVITKVRGGPIRPLRCDAWSTDSAHCAFLRPAANGRVAVEVGDRNGRGAKVVGRFWSDDHSDSRLLPANGGRFVYETSGVRSHRGLWTVRPDGSGLRRLLSDTGDDLSGPAWSRDGSRLAYGWAKGPPSGNAGFCCGRRIVIAAPDGRRLSVLPLGDDPDAYPSWSPDGTRFAVEHGLSGEIDVVQTNGDGRRVLTRNGRSPAWSPDGTTIAYANLSGDGIHTVSPDGTNDRTLLPVSASSVTWSPDGSLLAYAAADGLYVADSSGSGSWRVAAMPGSAHPSFSPDGKRIAFAATLDESYPPHVGVFVVDTDGASLKAIVRRDWYSASDPAWRPVSPGSP